MLPSLIFGTRTSCPSRITRLAWDSEPYLQRRSAPLRLPPPPKLPPSSDFGETSRLPGCELHEAALVPL
jgi:hypothetical protein